MWGGAVDPYQGDGGCYASSTKIFSAAAIPSVTGRRSDARTHTASANAYRTSTVTSTPGMKIDIVERETRATAISMGFPINVNRSHKDWPALALVASYLGQAVGWYRPGEGAGFIGAVVGAVIVLAIYRMVVGRRTV